MRFNAIYLLVITDFNHFSLSPEILSSKGCKVKVSPLKVNLLCTTLFHSPGLECDILACLTILCSSSTEYFAKYTNELVRCLSASFDIESVKFVCSSFCKYLCLRCGYMFSW